MPLVQVNGIERFYQETGSGEALLLINGLGGTSLSWEPLLTNESTQLDGVVADVTKS